MKIPDYISPIVGYRVWQWEASTSILRSLNGEPWAPGRPLSAKCRADGLRWSSRISHIAPHAECVCGIYAVKKPEVSRAMPCAEFGIDGEVNLWGTIVEHEFGWRAQFAYPKAIVLPLNTALLGMNEALSRVKSLASYGADILIDEGSKNILVWTKQSGHDPAGLDYLRSMNVPRVAPIAILTEGADGSLLQYGALAHHSEQLMFLDLRLPLVEPDSILFQIKLRQARVVVLDQVPEVRRWMKCLIDAIRGANRELLVFVRGEIDSVASRSALAVPDAYLAPNGRFDIQSTYASVVKKRATTESDQGMFPPPGAGPSGGPLPPPAAPAYLYRTLIPRRPLQSVATWQWSACCKWYGETR